MTMPASGWERFEGFLWGTSSLLVLAEDESLVVDPAISESEVAGIARRALELGAPVRHVLITHGDWDHVCGIGAFPDAVVAMGEETGEKVASGKADQSVRRAAEHYGSSRRDLRVSTTRSGGVWRSRSVRSSSRRSRLWATP